ncbi:hypothetical protein F0562_021658 [Nyssa sinensis]|uniref:Large ribosomal subunit protein uL18 C-terminal eukaryotes domain-containing protein n=1 Tax=Nyssa sinensis TaxID=561372 RepID=A0A5J5BLU5_9ASTE|nr:hypothetical protein F0562_021658 [Nyssa sinensis]
MKFREEVEEERRMLQMAEVWREERVQMKLVDAKVTLEEKYSQMNKLVADLETFLSSRSATPAPDAEEMKKAEFLRQAAALAFVKAQKTKAYFKSFQVKFKRRRGGKTDYRARIRLTNQDKNKYNTPKYRFVVTFTNKDIIAQITSASIAGDMVLAAAYAHELSHYGLEVGLTNYAAAYCTGLLLAHRVLKMLEMDDEYQGNAEATGEDFSVEPAESRRPFHALLDVGLLRTTTGNRVFGALKGALDGGLDIPHSDKRFAGFNKESKQLEAEVHHKYIYGGHVAAYMRTFSLMEHIKRGLEADGTEEMYKKVHVAIRADPSARKSEKQPPKEHKRYNLKKLSYEERKAKLIERLNALNSAARADDE